VEGHAAPKIEGPGQLVGRHRPTRGQHRLEARRVAEVVVDQTVGDIGHGHPTGPVLPDGRLERLLDRLGGKHQCAAAPGRRVGGRARRGLVARQERPGGSGGEAEEGSAFKEGASGERVAVPGPQQFVDRIHAIHSS